MDFTTLPQLDLTNRSVFLRLDLNVPLIDGVIQDDTRIRAALPTIQYILERTHKLVIASHLGRPKGVVTPACSLEPIGRRLSELLQRDVLLVHDYAEEPIDSLLSQLGKNQVILLENLRFHPEETAGSETFAKNLMKGIHLYVNDAFGALHRAHSSIYEAALEVPRESRAIGFLIEKEIAALTQLTTDVRRPYTLIMGGSKVEDKIGVMLHLLEHCNRLLIGGAMAYTFLEIQGFPIGNSFVEREKRALCQSILDMAQARKVEICLPIDHVCGKSLDPETPHQVVDGIAIPAGWMGLDIGPKTIRLFESYILNSSTVFWNGPMGVFEWPPFAKGSLKVAEAVGRCMGFTVVGGGDSVSAVNQAHMASRIRHVSTGGGASLAYLEGTPLPGLRVLEKRADHGG